jgi:hypothetical protein
VTHSLKDRCTMNFADMALGFHKLKDYFGLVLRGDYGRLGLNTDHRIQGSFSGGGFSAIQAAGFNHVDASQELGVEQWEVIAGYVHGFDHGRSVLVLGAGAQAETDKVLDRTWQIKAAAATYDDLVPLRRYDAQTDRLQVPVVMGAEIGVKPWLKARGMVTRNFFRFDGGSSTDEGYDSAGALTSSLRSTTHDDSGSDWKAALGFGLDLGSFSWDMAANSGLLGSAKGAAFVNPLYQSSFTYAF